MSSKLASKPLHPVYMSPYFCRRESTSIHDLFYAHISGMDALARGLRNAAALKVKAA